MIQLWQRRLAAAAGTPVSCPGDNDAKLAFCIVQDGQQYRCCSAVNCMNHYHSLLRHMRQHNSKKYKRQVHNENIHKERTDYETHFTDNSLLHRLSTR